MGYQHCPVWRNELGGYLQHPQAMHSCASLLTAHSTAICYGEVRNGTASTDSCREDKYGPC